MVVVVVGMMMLIADQTQKLGTITGFIVVFLGLISYTSVAKPFEALAATAA